MDGILSSPANFLFLDVMIDVVTICGVRKWLGGMFSTDLRG